MTIDRSVENVLETDPHRGDSGREVAVTKDAPQFETPGTEIGPFKLLQKLGEGGMGTVFLAEQKYPVRRRVALKIVKPGMDSKAIVGRFEAERQALSMMDHPNIARALDAGTAVNGRPYFVMELVKGCPITSYCDGHKLSIRDRLKLLLPICYAVQHAHQKGIVHRDLKPSNILVAEYDEEAVPKVIDFGVVKAMNQPLTEKTLFTQIGQIVGTLEYMSPEQAKGNELDVDTRSDVYSLGVLMYELLTGSTPHNAKRLRSAGLGEMIRIIRDEEPPAPSKRLSSSETLPAIASTRRANPARIGALVRGELDWIVMKALDKDRIRRYQTCGELADDVGRFLRDEQVRACPPTPTYLVSKFVRRNARAATGVCAVVVALLVGFASTFWQWRETQRNNRELAEQNLELKSIQRNTNQNIHKFDFMHGRDERLQVKLIHTFDSILAGVDRARAEEGKELNPVLDDLSAAMLDYWDAAIEESKQSDGSDGPRTSEYRIQRAFTLAHWGEHKQASEEAISIMRSAGPDLNRSISHSALLARVFGLCASSASDDQRQADRYIDRAMDLLTQAVKEAKLETWRIDRELEQGIQSDDKVPLIAAIRSLLECDDLSPLRQRVDEFASVESLFPDPVEHPDQDPSVTIRTISGFPTKTGARGL